MKEIYTDIFTSSETFFCSDLRDTGGNDSLTCFWDYSIPGTHYKDNERTLNSTTMKLTLFSDNFSSAS